MFVKGIVKGMQEKTKTSDEVLVETFKAEGEKCNVCWKIRKGKCERHGSLVN